MALDYGSKPDLPEGMTLTIFTEMDHQLSPPLNDAIAGAQSADEKKAAEDALEDARKNWKKISYAIAKGVVEHLTSSMEIYGVEVSISDVSTTVSTTTTCPAGAGSGIGSGSGTATGQQSNDGPGHVK